MLNDYLTFRYFGKSLLVLGVILNFCIPAFSQQQSTVNGKVINNKGEGLPGASVSIRGSSTTVLTNNNGEFAISCYSNSILIFSYIGFEQQEIQVNNNSVVNVVLTESENTLDVVEITALGIQKSSKSLTYSTQKVAGSELTAVPQTNLMNAVTGKVAGVNITQSASGSGGAVKVIIRGSKSINGNNQPLYVIDGIPMVNSSGQAINSLASSTDLGGDGISNLNPNDIESVTVLKGASAASLYGSQAANGVILITTKKGKAGVRRVELSSGFTVDKVAYLPEFQNSFGQTAPGSEESWGAPITQAPDNVSGFYKTGMTMVNSISLSSGNEKMQTYASYANTNATGILQNNKFSKHNLNFRSISSFFNEKLSLDANINAVLQQRDNPAISGLQLSTASGLFKFPRGLDISPYKEFEIFDPVRKVMTQNWPFINSTNQNPYWIMNRMIYEYGRNRLMINLSADYEVANGLNFRMRGSIDKTYASIKNKYYAGTTGVYAGPSGASSFALSESTQLYGEALLTARKRYGRVDLNLILGSSITDTRMIGMGINSSRLFIPNVFSLNNFLMEPGTGFGQNSESPHQLQSVFGNFNVSFNNWLVLDATARNDWSSNLSYTETPSFFYPSFGLNVLLHDALSLPEFISLAKLRGAYSIVGNTVPQFVTNPINYAGGGSVSFNTVVPFSDIKPEKTRSLELGTELSFFQNRLNLDFTYYKTNSINQFFTVSVPPGTGYTSRYINAGDIQNKGIEVVVGYSTIKRGNLGWNSMINFSRNKNEVLKLAEGFEQFVQASHETGFTNILTIGGAYGDIFGPRLKRDEQGRIAISAQGNPITNQTKELVGNANPDFQLGWKNTFTYKNMFLSVLVDGRFGGEIMSLSQQVFDLWGVSRESGEARLKGGMEINGYLDGTDEPVTTVDPLKWFKTLGSSAIGEYVYDATSVRVREVSLGYTLPSGILKSGFIKSVRLSVVSRNLLYIYNPAPVDPELAFSVGNGYQGIDALSIPATRSFGLNVNLSF